MGRLLGLDGRFRGLLIAFGNVIVKRSQREKIPLPLSQDCVSEGGELQRKL
jgi:hypothetical protein